jgi:hypothetical protein
MNTIRTKETTRFGRVRRGALGFLALGIGLTAGITFAASNNVLYLNGQVASTDVRTIGGSAYVRVSDVAKALGMNVAKRADGSTELVKEGGANQVGAASLQGKVGDTLFDGKWRLTVTSVAVTSKYMLKTHGEPIDTTGSSKYDITDRSVTPREGSELVVVTCRISNGQKSSQNLWLNNFESNTALADDTGEAYPPVGHDVDGAPTQTKPLLPGSKVDIPILFSVPQGKHITSFVFSLRNSDGRKGNDARVQLDVH